MIISYNQNIPPFINIKYTVTKLDRFVNLIPQNCIVCGVRFLNLNTSIPICSYFCQSK